VEDIESLEVFRVEGQETQASRPSPAMLVAQRRQQEDDVLATPGGEGPLPVPSHRTVPSLRAEEGKPELERGLSQQHVAVVDRRTHCGTEEA
jgi:hypothetical protein